MNIFLPGVDGLSELHEERGIKWDPLVHELLNQYKNQITIFKHDRPHGTGADCMEIVAEEGYAVDYIQPVVCQVGTMKNEEGKRVSVFVSFYGNTFKDLIRKEVGEKFGFSRKAGKEFQPEEEYDVSDLLGVEKGASGPFFNSAKYGNFERLVFVFDSTIEAEVLAVAVTRYTTMLIPRYAFESVMMQLSAEHPKMQIVKFPPLETQEP